MGEVTQLLLQVSVDNRAALDGMIPLVYAEPRNLAAGNLRNERAPTMRLQREPSRGMKP